MRRLSRRLAALAVALLVLAFAVTALAAGGQVQRHAFRTQALDEVRHYTVYLPPGYDADPERRYPVVYVLHGMGGSDRDFFERGGLARQLDTLIAAGEVPALIAVGPDGDSGYWVNHLDRPTRKGRRFGDYVALDLVAEVDARFRTRPDRAHRALAGVSMGGFGAVSLALTHPDRFGAAASLSGALFAEAPTHRKIYRPVWGHPPDAAHWRRTSAVALMSRLEPGPAAPRLYLSCGRQDRLEFAPLAQAASDLLNARGVDHALRLTPGGHTWDLWAAEGPHWLRWVARPW